MVRTRIKLFTIYRLNKVIEDIKNYGTSPSLFDPAIKNRTVVKKTLFPLYLS